MNFEEMQTILAGVVASQAESQASQVAFRETQAQLQASQATFEANQAHFQAAFRENMELMRQDIANTQAIVNSNARAIEATANQQVHDRELQANTQRQLLELAQIVRQMGESSDRRLTALEDRQ